MSQYTRYPVLSGGGGGSGTVTEINIDSPNNSLTISGSPITTSGTIDIELASGSPNTFAGYDSTGTLTNIPGWQFANDGEAQIFLNGPFPANDVTQFQFGAIITTPLSGGYEGMIFSPQLSSTMAFTSSFNSEAIYLSGFALTGGIQQFNDQAEFNSGASSSNYNSFSAFPHIDGSTTYSGMTFGPALTSTTNFTSMISANPQFNSGYTNPDSIQTFGDGSQMFSGSSVRDYISLNLSPSLSPTSIASITGIIINPQIGTTPSDRIHGIDMNFGNFSSAPYLPVALDVSQGTINQNATLDTQFITPDSVYGLNQLGGEIHVSAGFPITAGQFGFGNNIGVALLAEDNINIDSTGVDLGFSSVGFVGQVEVAAGKTVATMNLMAAGAGVPGGSGAITNLSMFRALGLLPEGGTVAVTNMFGFKADPVLAAIGATNTWAFYDGSASENFVSKLAINTSSKKVTNSDVGLEVGSLKAILLARMTTTQKNALVAVAGMVVYDTTLNQMSYYNGTSWVNV